MDISIHSKYKVKEIRNLTESTYVVQMNRYGMAFQSGQNLNVGLAGDTEKRDYSIYSGVKDDYLEVLVKEVEDGLVSKQLKRKNIFEKIMEFNKHHGLFVFLDFWSRRG